MATDNTRAYTKSINCPGTGKLSLQYLLAAAAFALPKSLFLGRMTLQVIKPTVAAKKQAATFMRAPAGRRKSGAKAARRRRK